MGPIVRVLQAHSVHWVSTVQSLGLDERRPDGDLDVVGLRAGSQHAVDTHGVPTELVGTFEHWLPVQADSGQRVHPVEL